MITSWCGLEAQQSWGSEVMEETTSIEQLRIPETLIGDAAADFLEAVEVSRLVRLHTWGNDELAYTAEELFAQCHDPFEWYVVLVARDSERMIGRAGIAMPLDDNTELAHVTLDVLPDAEGKGVGRRLLEAAELFVRGENRKIVMVETNHPAAALSALEAEQIGASRGPGVLPLKNREARFALNSGYELERVEQFSSRTLPLDDELVTELTDKAIATHQSAYTVHQWLDSCPERWAPEIVRLERSMGMDDDDRQEPWDVDKLRETESISAVSGRRTIVSAAECLQTGRLVGFTTISILGHRSDVAFQDETIVEPPHKGKAVGLHIKVANMALLMREFPATTTLFSWNSPASSDLLSVNGQLGFVSAGVTGQWRKDFNAMQ